MRKSEALNLSAVWFWNVISCFFSRKISSKHRLLKTKCPGRYSELRWMTWMSNIRLLSYLTRTGPCGLVGRYQKLIGGRSEDGGFMFFLNAGIYRQASTALRPRRQVPAVSTSDPSWTAPGSSETWEHKLSGQLTSGTGQSECCTAARDCCSLALVHIYIEFCSVFLA